MQKFPTRHFILGMIVLFSLIGGVVAIYATANGPWGYTDPVEYISVARSLDHGQGLAYYEGNGLLTPETIHPPLYSSVLAAIGIFGINLVVASRWLNIFAFVASIFIAGWIFYRYSPVPALGIIASALMCAFPYMLIMFSSSYSEPLFILSILAGGWAVLAYLRNQKTSQLVLGALVVSTIPGTRYAGIAMVLAAGLTVFLFANGTAWLRTKKAVLLMFIGGLPVLAWLVWVYLSSAHSVGGRTTDIQLSGILAQFQNFRGIFMDTVWKWVPYQTHETLLGYRLRFILMGVIAAVLLGLSLLAVRHMKKDTRTTFHDSDIQIFAFFGLSSLLFVGMLILTYLFTLPTIDIDNRMLLPLFVSSVMMIYGAVAVWWAAWFKGWLRVLQAIPWIMAVVCVAWYFPQAREKVQFYHLGDGLTIYRWDKSSLIQAVRDLPADQPVISNDWELTMLWTGRPIHGFWTTFSTELPMQASSYGTNQNDHLQPLFCEQGAALVIFADFPTQVRDQVGESAVDQIPNLFNGLSLYGKYTDGAIYLCH